MFAWRDNYISYNGAGGAANDPFWTSVSLLLNYETPQTTFTDGSNINALVTVAAGTPKPNLRTPFASGAGASIFFNGAANTFLSAPANVAYAFGTGDFTVELWYYRTVTSAAAALAGPWSGVASTSTWLLTQGNSNTSAIRWGSCDGTNVAFVESSTCIVNNAWGHIAVTRSSGTLRIFYNGTQVFSGANTFNMSPFSTGLQVMSVTGSFLSTGFISNLRIVKGTAVYTTAFTPPTSPLTAITNTTFLLNCTNQGQATTSATVYTDQGPNAFAITAVSAPTWAGLTPFTNSYPGSISFNGSSGLLSAATSGNLVNTNFTWECWVRFNSLSGAPCLMASSFVGDTRTILYFDSTNGIRYAVARGADQVSIQQGSTAGWSTGVWYHVALVRNGNVYNIYRNGTSVATGTNAYAQSDLNAGLSIGYSNASGSFLYLNGFISNARVVNGTAVYTSSFTPPTTPLTAITNTRLLISGNTGSLYDLSNNGNRLTTGQSTQTTVFKYGTQGGLNTSGITTVVDATNLQFTTGDFTIEGWIYRNTAGVVGGIISKGTSTTGWRVRVNASNQLVFAVTAADAKTSTTTIPATTWTYFAWTRSGSTNYMFINGTQEGSTFTDSTNFNQTNNLLVGSDGVNTTLQGYMDEVRLTKGVARYTATFTAPSSAFPTS